jgi:hypothetical protein
MKHRITWGIPALLLVFGLFIAGCDINGEASMDAALGESLLEGTWQSGSTELIFKGGKLSGTVSGVPIDTLADLKYSLKSRTTPGMYDLTVITKPKDSTQSIPSPSTWTVAYEPEVSASGMTVPANIIIGNSPYSGNYDKQ